MKKLTTIKIGGKARYVAFPKNQSELRHLVEYLKKKNVKFFVLGNGSNTLPCDGRYNGVIIKLTEFSTITCNKNVVQAEAGANLASVIKFAIDHSLSGFEEASGIPGTVGGAVRMNAGAFNFEVSKLLKSVYILRDNEILFLKNSDCGFAHRTSGFKDDDIILSAYFKLEKGNKEEILARQKEVLEKRKHLPTLPSLGSVFKRVDGVIVSQMLDEMKLRGLTFGGAMVSMEHAGIIVNKQNATSEDVKTLIAYIKKRCFLERNIVLKEEIKYLE